MSNTTSAAILSNLRIMFAGREHLTNTLNHITTSYLMRTESHEAFAAELTEILALGELRCPESDEIRDLIREMTVAVEMKLV